MRENFLGWYQRTPEQLSAIWDTALFVPDANILLHCLRHPENVRNELLRLFGGLRMPTTQVLRISSREMWVVSDSVLADAAVSGSEDEGEDKQEVSKSFIQ